MTPQPLAHSAPFAESAAPLLELKDVGKDYVSGDHRVAALRSVSLTVGRGEFVAIVGASGSGKSTLMNVLGCLDRPTRGTFCMAGAELGGRSNAGRALARNRLIGFVFQGFNLMPRLTALENVELPLQYRKVPRGQRRARALRALETVGLAERVHHKPSQLSGGQQQRVTIARALVTNPPLLLADEPTGNLDTRTTFEILALLQTLNRDLGVTIVMVTHEPDVAACAKRVVTVRDGSIVDDQRRATPDDAAAALLRLPAPAGGARGGIPALVSVPRERGGGRLLPAYVAMCAGSVLGGAAGLAYARLLLDLPTNWIPAVAAVIGEGALTSHLACRGRSDLDAEALIRVAVGYTLATTTLMAAILCLFNLSIPGIPWRDLFADASAIGLAKGVALVLLVLVGGSLLRYLLFLTIRPILKRPATAIMGALAALTVVLAVGSASVAIRSTAWPKGTWPGPYAARLLGNGHR
jgi:putative ABC transport system ATP-binding protein